MIRLLTLGLAGCVLAACTYSGPNHVYPGYGEATANNAAVMIVDPNPPGSQNTDIPLEGDRAAGAYDAYQADKVEQPVTLNTTESLSGGGAE